MLINPYIYASAVSTDFKITVDTTQAGSASDTFVLPLQSGTTSMTAMSMLFLRAKSMRR